MALSNNPPANTPAETTLEGKWREAVLHKESLRLEHNATGKQFTGGGISQQDWDAYKLNDWRPRMELAQEAEDDAYHAMYMSVINGR